MIASLPKMKMPEWIASVGDKKPIPLQGILRGSLYYPSSGFDGDPVKYLSGNIYSFIYVDYGKSRDELVLQLYNPGFRGYHILLSRSVTEKELTPNGWSPSPPSMRDGDPSAYYDDWIKKPFANWSVFQRNDGLTNEHGSERFSLLYLCADGVAAFQALYLSNKCFPKGIAIIQPGHGFGCNWTDYTDPRKILARTVLNNSEGKPKILLYGGIGKRNSYRKPCWPQYSEHICFLEKSGSFGGSIGVWQKNT